MYSNLGYYIVGGRLFRAKFVWVGVDLWRLLWEWTSENSKYYVNAKKHNTGTTTGQNTQEKSTTYKPKPKKF